MRNTKVGALLCLILTVSLATSGCTLWTVVRNEKQAAGGGTQFYFDDNSFDADKYVASIWEDKVLPHMTEKAADAGEVAALAKDGLDKAGEKYGFRTSSVGTAWNFIVKGKARVLKINTASRNGTAELDLAPYDGAMDMILQIGPVFKGTSVRDALDFIKFDDYKNQMVFASISTAFNTYIRDHVTQGVNTTDLEGKEIEFIGAFTGESADNLVVTPVRITRDGEGT